MVADSPDITILLATSNADFESAKALIEDYAAEIAIDLCFQNFTEELANLRALYGPPSGALLLARKNGETIGCVGVRYLSDGVCEMKRLYVKPACRRLGLGRRLTQEAIDYARALCYRRMVLDTLTSMTIALSLYNSMGFQQIDAYYDSPLQEVHYLALDLAAN